LIVDAGTLLFIIVNALFLLAAVALVLWPVLVALLELYKALRSPVAEPTTFTLTKSGATVWHPPSQSATSKSLSMGDERLRLSILLVCGMEAAFIVFLAVFLFQHADPHGDGMEMAAVGFSFMLIFLPFTLPAFILARHRRWLVAAAGVAALAAVAYFALWLEMVSELGLPKS
jgi:hypothetical protein